MASRPQHTSSVPRTAGMGDSIVLVRHLGDGHRQLWTLRSVLVNRQDPGPGAVEAPGPLVGHRAPVRGSGARWGQCHPTPIGHHGIKYVSADH